MPTNRAKVPENKNRQLRRRRRRLLLLFLLLFPNSLMREDLQRFPQRLLHPVILRTKMLRPCKRILLLLHLYGRCNRPSVEQRFTRIRSSSWRTIPARCSSPSMASKLPLLLLLLLFILLFILLSRSVVTRLSFGALSPILLLPPPLLLLPPPLQLLPPSNPPHRPLSIPPLIRDRFRLPPTPRFDFRRPWRRCPPSRRTTSANSRREPPCLRRRHCILKCILKCILRCNRRSRRLIIRINRRL